MAFRDLREFILATKEIGEVKEVEGADWNGEIGCITELMAERGGPLLLFDDIKGYPKGFRVVSNFVSTPKRMALALGMPLDVPPLELVRLWKERLKEFSPLLPIELSEGAIMENRMEGEKVDLYKFPAPKWHEMDGGRYIGTADMVIIKDPETGWVNIGTYRSCIQGKDRLSLWILNFKHGRIIAERYWAKENNCPVAIVLGCEPATWLACPSAIPYGLSEYDYAGFLRGAPVEIVKGKITGLPIPAYAEIVVEGEIPPLHKESVLEGPFGEWPGYYAHTGHECVVKVQSIMYRNDPIILGAPPLRPITDRFSFFAAHVWDHLERSGITDIQGVWCYCNLLLIVIALKQRYAGQAKQALLAASSIRSGGMNGYVVVVDEDIDPSNLNEVLWALCTRVDPETSIEIIRGTYTSGLDPRLSQEKKKKGDLTVGRALIDACKPFSWKAHFPASNVFSREMRKQIWEKWERKLTCNDRISSK